MEQFKIGETVVRRGSISAKRGTIVRVTDDGFFVTVKWPSWLGLEAYESTRRAHRRGVPRPCCSYSGRSCRSSGGSGADYDELLLGHQYAG